MKINAPKYIDIKVVMCYIRHEKGNTSERLPTVYELLIKITAKFVRLGAVIFMLIFYFLARLQSRLKRFRSELNQTGLCTQSLFPFVYFPCKTSFPGVLGIIFQREGNRPPLWYCRILLYHIWHSMTILSLSFRSSIHRTINRMY